MKPTRNPRKRPDSTGRLRSDAAIRREKLQQIDDTGTTEGIHPASLRRFWEKGYLTQNGKTVTLTKKGKAVMAGNIGKVGRGAVDFDTANRAGKNSRDHAARAQAMTREGGNRAAEKAEKEWLKQKEQEHSKTADAETRALEKIVGSYAVTIAPSDGSTMDAGHMADLVEAGWTVAAAPTAPARLGSRLPGSRRERFNHDEPFTNPSDPLGPMGEARAVIIRSNEPLDLDTLSTIRHHGFDLTPAPAKMRKFPPPTKPTRNPHGNQKPRNRERWEITGTKSTGFVLWVDGSPVEEAGSSKIKRYRTIAAARSAAKRFFDRYTVKNPSPGEMIAGPHASAETRKMLAKALAWFGDENLVTEPRILKNYEAPQAVVEIGDMVAIEYDSNKFDGEWRIYRHEATRKRKLFISPDGSTLIVWPPFKITKRGIEG